MFTGGSGAFTIVFVVIAGLVAIIFGKRYLAMILEKKGTGVGNAPSATASQTSEEDIKEGIAAISAAVFAHANQANDVKKVAAAVAAVINVTIGRNMNIINVTPAQCSDMNKMWRTTGITECMKSRLGSRSW